MEKSFEQKMKAHERGVSVLGKLATSFGVHVTDEEQDRWLTLLSLSREIEDASHSEDFFAGLCQKALMQGEAYGHHIPAPLAQRFRVLYEASEGDAREELEELAPAVVSHAANVDDAWHRLSDVTLRSVDLKVNQEHFQKALADDGRYHASLLTLPLDKASGAERVNREQFNRWLQEFFIAYEQVGKILHIRANGESQWQNDRVFSQTAVACRSLMRCLAQGTPRSALTLFIHGTARAGRKLVGRL